MMVQTFCEELEIIVKREQSKQLLILRMLILYMRKCLRKQNKYEDAITWVDKALAIDPKHVYSLNEKGECLRLLKEYIQSLQLLDQALCINPQDTFSLNCKGDCLRDQQKYKEALICYEKSLKIDPNNQYSKNQNEFCKKKLNQ
ncbi:unnamed protein product [Paramecium octaurelia]|uniref:Tetratricopeptide repeat protein n=1 Tax=Paramecium octaurelia TaxID=43137 RepID=A0A8S1YRR2_PAROT|nr:unnamed protein product [Paramecium octaurelia]